MKIERYAFEKFAERYYYEFYSVGPKGTIRKLVCFALTEEWPRTFNVILGDSKEQLLEIDDKIVTNNNDSKKVLQTVGMIVLEFLMQNPDAHFTVYGETPSRNRLYRLFITRFWNDIGQYFSVFGRLDDKWHFFEGGTTYNGYLFINKKTF